MHFHSPDMTASSVQTWRDGGVAHIRFNRPAALNAIDLEMAASFRAACAALEQDASVRAVVLSGEGRAFMAGGDLAAMQEDPVGVASGLIAHMHGAIRILTSLPTPVIASVHGAVAGGGLGLALSCDLCIAAEDTRFSMVCPLVGTSPDCGTSWGLARALGLRQALQFALLGETIPAGDALRLGMVNRVVPADAFVEATTLLAKSLAAGPTAALGRTKRLIRNAAALSVSSQLDFERDAFLESAATSDFREGVAAFLDKRKPSFTGR